MDKFVCVRLVRAETLDLTLFDFDPDLSFAVFLMNADKTIYGRFGTRSDFYEAERDVSLEGLRVALEKALKWHEDVEKLAEMLKAKRPAETKYKVLSDYPSARRRRRGGGGRCTHCHDIRSAQQLAYRREGKPIPENVLFSWPMPDAAGLNLDPKKAATVLKVWDDSPAKESGFKPGDEIEKLEGQPILSIADVQWVLQNAPDDASLKAEVRRDGKLTTITWKLAPGWRRYVDISWRSTTGVLRQVLAHGVTFQDLSAKDRQAKGLKRSRVALKIRSVPFNRRGRSGFDLKVGDIVIGIDDKTGYMSEGDLLAYIGQQKKSGDMLRYKVLRGEEKLDVEVRLD